MNCKYIRSSILLGLAFSLASCHIGLKPINKQDRETRIKKDWEAMFACQEPVKKPIDMPTAMARALKYNLDIRLKTLEAAMDKRQWNLTSYNMLPEVAATAGYLTRSNVNAAESIGIADGAVTVPPSTSQDIDRRVYDLQGSWNVLDFGIGYINTLQHGDQYMITQQRRRKMIQNVIRDVRFAYWRALSAQRIRGRLNRLRRRVDRAITKSQRINTKRLKAPLLALRYQRSLYDVMRFIQILEKNMVQAQAELGALMNVPTTTHYRLVDTSSHIDPLPKAFPKKRLLLEKIALLDRPELREEDYRQRIAWHDITIARLKMIPGFAVLGGRNYDSNSFLVYNQWANLSLQLSWNILNFIKGPANIKAAKLNSSIANMRRKALSMAVITQVDVAYYQYFLAKKNLNSSYKMKNVERKIYKQVSSEYNAQKTDELDLIRSEANLLLADLRYNLDNAEYQNTGGQLLSTIGYDTVPLFPDNLTVSELSAIIKKCLNTPVNMSKLNKHIKALTAPNMMPPIKTQSTSAKKHIREIKQIF